MNVVKGQMLKTIKSDIKKSFIGFRSLSVEQDKYYSFSINFPENVKSIFKENFLLFPDFITDIDEKCFMDEIEPVMKRMRYEYDHWDQAIQGFRETEKSRWKKPNSDIIDKIKKLAFSDSSCMSHVHVLDLAPTGHINPHIDSEKFCGKTIAGVCLLSDAIMRLSKGHLYFCDVLLRRRSLYIMRGSVRYDFTHEILPNEKSLFQGKEILKGRRISVILRSEPAD